MSIEITAHLRRKNQLTWPEEIAGGMDVGEGSELLIVLDEQTGEARVRAVRRSYAGALKGTYGDPREVRRYLGEERRGWKDR